MSSGGRASMSADRWVGWKLDSRPLFVGKDAEAVLLLGQLPGCGAVLALS